jgi:hypothetical protein
MQLIDHFFLNRMAFDHDLRKQLNNKFHKRRSKPLT